MMGLRGLMSWLVALGMVSCADAGVLVLANTTEDPITLTIGHATGPSSEVVLAPGEVRPVSVGREPTIRFQSMGKNQQFQLEPYTAYVFARSALDLTLHGIESAAPLPKSDDVPVAPPAALAPLRVIVELYVDEAQPRIREAWEKRLRARVEAASAILDRQLGVSLTVDRVGTWKTAPEAEDLHARLADFEKQVKPAKLGHVCVGFTSRPAVAKSGACPLGCTRGPLHSHVLVRDGQLLTEPEEVELLIHELAHLLGAAHSPDSRSAARVKLGDGQARSLRFRVGLDPLNLLATAIWAEEFRTGKVRTWADLSLRTRDRLEAVYQTIRHALPEDPVANEYLAILKKLKTEIETPPGTSIPGTSTPAPSGVDSPKLLVLTPKEEAARVVLRAVVQRARVLATAVDRPRGDRLTAEYLQAARTAARGVEADLQVPAFLIGFGVALDDSGLLQKNPVTGKLCQSLESEPERRERLAVLGLPTIHSRRDLCQHFVVSALLAEVQGPAMAEAAGLIKELSDLDGASGFSFADLAADYAGVTFAQWLRKDPSRLGQLPTGLAMSELVPSVSGLREGLSRKRFETDFGDAADPRLVAALDMVRTRIAALPMYQK